MRRRYPVEPLAEAMGMTVHAALSSLRLSGSTQQEYRARGLTADVADRLAIAAGLHPFNIWPDYGPDTEGDDLLPGDRHCERCGTPYTPVRVKQRWCSPACRLYNSQAAYQRRRWANDPVWAEQQRERVRRYRQETAAYQRAQAKIRYRRRRAVA